jgi:hypothetical protein
MRENSLKIGIEGLAAAPNTEQRLEREEATSSSYIAVPVPIQVE